MSTTLVLFSLMLVPLVRTCILCLCLCLCYDVGENQPREGVTCCLCPGALYSYHGGAGREVNGVTPTLRRLRFDELLDERVSGLRVEGQRVVQGLEICAFLEESSLQSISLSMEIFLRQKRKRARYHSEPLDETRKGVGITLNPTGRLARGLGITRDPSTRLSSGLGITRNPPTRLSSGLGITRNP